MPLTPETFTKLFAAHLQMEAPDLAITVRAPLELEIQPASGEPQNAFLTNSYNTYLLNPNNLAYVLKQFGAAMLETARTMGATIDTGRILPIIKDAHFLQEVQQQAMKARGMGTEMPRQVCEPYNSELVILYAEDTPRNIRYLTQESLSDLHLDIPQLRKLARENLQFMLGRPKVEGSNGRFIVKAGGDYEASLLLLDSLWTEDAFDVEGDIVVGIPARDVLLVAGSKDPEALKSLKQFVDEVYRQAPYRLTSKLFVHRGEKFEVFEEAA